MQDICLIREVEFYDAGFLPMRAHIKPRRFSSFSFRKSGCVTVAAEDIAFASEGGTVTYIPAGCGYQTEVKQAGEMYVMHLVTEEGMLPFGDVPRLATPRDAQSLVHLFQRALKHSRAEKKGYSLMADAYSLLSELQTLFAGEQPVPNERMINCKRYMDEHITQASLRVSALAAMYFTSEVQFRADFRHTYGESPIRYIKRRRIEIAKSLLDSHLYSVADVAVRSGFDSISYFSSEFRRATGFSPREYSSH